MTEAEYLRHAHAVDEIIDRTSRCCYTYMGESDYASRAASILREIARRCVSEAWRLEHEEQPA